LETRIFTVPRTRVRTEDIAEPAKILAAGGLVVFPTETLYGLGASLERPEAMERLMELTKSPPDRRLTIHLGHAFELTKHVREVPPAARRMIRRFWPGPLTLLLQTREGIVRGFRLSSDEVAIALLRAAAVPVVAPPVAVGDAPPLSDPGEIARHFSGRIDALIDSGPSRHSRLSTIVDFTSPKGCVIAREGVVPREKIEEACRKRILFVCTGNTCRSPMAAGLMRRALALRLGVPEEKLEEKGWVVESAGVGAYDGAPATEEAMRVVEEMGCRARAGSSRRLTEDMIDGADRIFTMTRAHLEQVITMVPDAVGKSRRLDQTRDIEDPIGGGVEAYRAAARQIKKALDSVVKSL